MTPLWKEEVSFREADERYVGRRQFGKFLVLTSLGMFVGNLWILVRSWLSPPMAFPRRPIARISRGRMAVGDVLPFAYPTPDDPCILIRLDEDTYVAYQQKCTHLSCAVVYSGVRDRLECPCHHGYFSARTGQVLQGPPPRPLPRIRLERDGDDLYAVGIDLGEG